MDSSTFIYLGTASCGRAAGAMKVLESIQATLKNKQLEAIIVQVGCVGPCYLEPLMDVSVPGHPRISYGNVTPAKANEIIESCLTKGDPILRLAAAHFGD